METNSNRQQGLDFEYEIEAMLKENGIPFLSQVDYKDMSSICDIIVATKTKFRPYIIYNLSIKKSLRERYKLSAFEQVGLDSIYWRRSKSYVVTLPGKEAENLIKKIPKKKDLKKTLKGVIYSKDLVNFLIELSGLATPDINDKRIKNFNRKRSNLCS